MQPPSSRHWVIADPLTTENSQSLDMYPEVIRQLLVNRGVTDNVQAMHYLEGKVEFGDPFLMTDMGAAVDRLIWALDHGEKIAIFGDFDVDGVTSTALMVEALSALGGNIIPYIPDRYDEGYGLNNDALTSLKNEGVTLVLSVDCGIRSVVEARHALSIDLDLLISDHHHVGSELPPAYAVIDPKREGDSYPDKGLAGVGVAYKIIQALLKKRPQPGVTAEDWLDLVALGTVADMVPLTGENRLLVRKGLQQLRFGRRQGIVSLAGAAKLNLAALTTTNIAFGLAPRLNAAGRLESAHDAYHLLVTRDLSEAGFLAQKLDDQNTKRQTQTREMQQIAERQLVEADEEFILFAIDPEFKAGLVGLVAARLTDVFYRPAVVCSWVDGAIRASCRSIPGFHITQALDQCADILVRHGGHEAAAGFTVSEEYYGQLKERLSKIAWEELAGLDLRPVIRIDREMHLQELKADLLDWMEMFQPTGQNNPEVVFCSRNLKVVTAKTVGNDKTHLKFSVSEDGLVFDAIAFRFGHMAANMPKKVDLAYQFEKNYYLGRESLQLKVVDIKPGGTPD